MPAEILLVDDEVDFTELTSTLLVFNDIKVDVCNDSTQVELKVDTGNYDLIVTDLMMPNPDGFDLIGKLREKDKFSTTPIIALSAKSLTDAERKFLMQKEVHFIAKPFEPQNLVDKIKTLIFKKA